MVKKVSVKEKVDKAKKELITEATPEAAKNVSKLEGDMEFSVKTLIEKIKESRSITELESTQDYFEGIFGVDAEIPSDIQDLYNSKVSELKAMVPGNATFPIGWVKMTREEAKANEAKGLLMGYDAELGCGLLK